MKKKPEDATVEEILSDLVYYEDPDQILLLGTTENDGVTVGDQHTVGRRRVVGQLDVGGDGVAAAAEIGGDVEVITVNTSNWCDPGKQADAAQSLIDKGVDVITQHHATIGLRYETERWWVGGGYMLAFRTSLEGPGYSKIPLGIDYGRSTMAQTVHSFIFGFGFNW